MKNPVAGSRFVEVCLTGFGFTGSELTGSRLAGFRLVVLGILKFSL